MSYFWYHSGNIPKGLGYNHFDPLHLCWLAAFAVVTVTCCLAYRRLGEKGRSCMRKTIALLLLGDEFWKIIPLSIMGEYDATYLPFQLCSINILLILWHAFKPGEVVGSFLYTVCIPAALAALLFPTWTKLPAWNFMLIHSFTVHIMLALYPIMLTAAGDIRPRLRQVPKCLALLLALAAFALLMNLLLDTNFMFLRSVKSDNPLYIFEKLWGNHLLGFPVIIAGVVLVMYAPIEFYHAIRKKKSRKATA